MGHIGVTLNNAFAKPIWDNVKYWSKLVAKYKGVEVEILRDNQLLVTVSLDVRMRCDHAGVELCLGLFGYSISFKYYDTRHWDYENNRWQVYE